MEVSLKPPGGDQKTQNDLNVSINRSMQIIDGSPRSKLGQIQRRIAKKLSTILG